MLSVRTISLLAWASVSLAAPVETDVLETRAACTGAYVIWARGSYETASNASLLPLINNIVFATGGSSYQVQYPATIIPTSSDPAYQSSVTTGQTDAKNHIRSYVASCGSSAKIVLLGYSQGGQVVSDTLGGNALQPISYPGIESQYYDKIVAAVSFGDPTYTLPSNYAAGDSTKSGVFKRQPGDSTQNVLTSNFGNKFRSYCTEGDVFCSTNQAVVSGAHLAEVQRWQSAAQSFVLSKFGK